MSPEYVPERDRVYARVRDVFVNVSKLVFATMIGKSSTSNLIRNNEREHECIRVRVDARARFMLVSMMCSCSRRTGDGVSARARVNTIIVTVAK